MTVKLLYNPDQAQFNCACNYNYVIVGRNLVHQMDNMIDVYDTKECSPLHRPVEGATPILSICLPEGNNFIIEGIRSSLTSERVSIFCEDNVKLQDMIIDINIDITVKVSSRKKGFQSEDGCIL